MTNTELGLFLTALLFAIFDMCVMVGLQLFVRRAAELLL